MIYKTTVYDISVSWYEFAVSLNDTEESVVELPSEAILSNISSLLVPAGNKLMIQINASEYIMRTRLVWMSMSVHHSACWCKFLIWYMDDSLALLQATSNFICFDFAVSKNIFTKKFVEGFKVPFFFCTLLQAGSFIAIQFSTF